MVKMGMPLITFEITTPKKHHIDKVTTGPCCIYISLLAKCIYFINLTFLRWRNLLLKIC